MTTLPKHELTNARFQIALEVVAKEYELAERAIIGRTRLAHVVRARHALYLVLATAFDTTHSEIGRLLGRDHSTIAHGVQVGCRRLGADERYRRDISRLIGSIESAIEAHETRKAA